MAKKVHAQVKLQIPAGQAKPSPPVGPALAPTKVNIKQFCDEFNNATRPMASDGLIIPVVVTVYSDQSFTFQLKTPPVPILLLRAAKLEKGSGVPNRKKVGRVTLDQVREIATTKLPDLNCTTLEAAISQVVGTARSAGIDVV